MSGALVHDGIDIPLNFQATVFTVPFKKYFSSRDRELIRPWFIKIVRCMPDD